MNPATHLKSNRLRGYEFTRRSPMTIKLMLALGVAAIAVTATPSEARRHYTNHTQCTKWRHGECVAWHRLTRKQAMRAGYRVGYRFGPSYSYTEVDALPQPIVTRYHLGSNFRYVNQNGYVYVVNPRTYRVVRVISAPM
jgi:hypothetical protein